MGFLEFFTVLLALVFNPAVASGTEKYHIPGMFIFGDSLVDAGNNNYLNATFKANFPPYGETFFKEPTGRFTDGRTVVDFLAQNLRLPFIPPYLKPNADFRYGANFASAGSGALNSTNSLKGIIPLNKQFQNFVDARAKLQKQLGDKAAGMLIRRSLFVIVTGSNDLVYGYLSNDTTPKTIDTAVTFVSQVAVSVATVVRELVSIGARKIAVFGVGPIGCTPAVKAKANITDPTKCDRDANSLAFIYTMALCVQIGKLISGAPSDAHILFGNSLGTFNQLMTQAPRQGFKNTSYACCGRGRYNGEGQCGTKASYTDQSTTELCSKPEEHLFWDFIHPTEHSNRQLAKAFWQGASTYILPKNIQTLASLRT